MQQDSKTKLTAITAHWNTSKEQLRHVREMMLIERKKKDKISEKLEVAERKIGKMTFVEYVYMMSVVDVVTTGELFPLEYRLEAEKMAKEEAVTAKFDMEKKAREFVTEQKNTIERLNKEKVSDLSPFLSVLL